MIDPFGSMGGFLNQFRGFVQNPMQFIMRQKLNIPQDAFQNPQETVQNLMNSGRMSQQDFNKLQQAARRIMNEPQFSQMFGK